MRRKRKEKADKIINIRGHTKIKERKYQYLCCDSFKNKTMNNICKTCYTKFQTSRKANYGKNKKLKSCKQEQHVNVIQPFNDLLPESQGHIDSNKDNLHKIAMLVRKRKI